mgnify:CR=1 FL=1
MFVMQCVIYFARNILITPINALLSRDGKRA